MKETKKIVIVSVIILVIAALGWTGYNQWIEGKKVAGEKEITVTILKEEDDYKKEYTYKTTQDALGEVLEEEKIVTAADGPFGRFIVGMDGMMADENKQEWWAVKVNGKDAETGIDSVMIKDGDKFEFIFMTGW